MKSALVPPARKAARVRWPVRPPASWPARPPVRTYRSRLAWLVSLDLIQCNVYRCSVGYISHVWHPTLARRRTSGYGGDGGESNLNEI